MKLGVKETPKARLLVPDLRLGDVQNPLRDFDGPS